MSSLSINKLFCGFLEINLLYISLQELQNIIIKNNFNYNLFNKIYPDYSNTTYYMPYFFWKPKIIRHFKVFNPASSNLTWYLSNINYSQLDNCFVYFTKSNFDKFITIIINLKIEYNIL